MNPTRSFALGLVGLDAGGRRLALDLAGHGHSTLAFDPDPDARRALSAAARARGGARPVLAATAVELGAALRRPRCVLLSLPHGGAVDRILADLRPVLEPGDILVDIGDSHYLDTERRARELARDGLRLLGIGVTGVDRDQAPALMPGGDPEAWRHLSPALEALAGDPLHNAPVWLGPRGAGHLVKTVHDGVESALVGLLSEAYELMARRLRIPPGRAAALFEQWAQGPLEGHLARITPTAIRAIERDGAPLRRQLGHGRPRDTTGAWLLEMIRETHAPAPVIELTAAPGHARHRLALQRRAPRPGASRTAPPAVDQVLADLPQALYLAMMVTYVQGLRLVQRLSRARDYGIRPADVISAWDAGSPIRARMLELLGLAYRRRPLLANPLLDIDVADVLLFHQVQTRRTLDFATASGLRLPGLSAAYAYYQNHCARRLGIGLTDEPARLPGEPQPARHAQGLWAQGQWV